jgi:hypothetical protein
MRPRKEETMRCLWWFVGLGLLIPATVRAQGADEVIRKHAEAVGGRATLGKVEDRIDRWSLTLEGPATGTGTFIVHSKGPTRYREVVQGEFGGNKYRVVQGYYGKTAWRVSQGQLAILEGEERDAMRNRALRAVGGDLYRSSETGAKVVLKGKVKVDDRDTYALEVTPKTGRAITYYIDTDSYLLVKSSTTSGSQGVESEVHTWPFDYREVRGLQIAHGLEIVRTYEGTEQEQRFVLTRQRVEINTGIRDGIFSPPRRPSPEKKRGWY